MVFLPLKTSVKSQFHRKGMHCAQTWLERKNVSLEMWLERKSLVKIHASVLFTLEIKIKSSKLGVQETSVFFSSWFLLSSWKFEIQVSCKQIILENLSNIQRSTSWQGTLWSHGQFKVWFMSSCPVNDKPILLKRRAPRAVNSTGPTAGPAWASLFLISAQQCWHW